MIEEVIANSATLNQPADFVVVADEKELQIRPVLPEEQAQLQSRAAFKNVLSQAADRYARMCMGTSETIGNRRQRGFHARDIRVTQASERGAKPGGKKDGGLTHA
jgi:hypothetical protein